MTRYEVDTESGSRYIIDTELKVMRRERARQAPKDPAVGVSFLKHDGLDIPYDELVHPLEVGSHVYAVWNEGSQFRLSTKITGVKEIGVSTGADQPA